MTWRRRLAIVFLALGAAGGFASGFHQLRATHLACAAHCPRCDTPGAAPAPLDRAPANAP